MSIPPTISHWLVSATERAATRTISPGWGAKEDTTEIVTLPTHVTFQPGTTAGRIFAKRLVLMDLRQGIGIRLLALRVPYQSHVEDNGPQVEQCRH